MILSVVIKEAASGYEYVGTGVIKNIVVSRKDPDMTVHLQIDVMDPLDRKFRQQTPDRYTHYRDRLDFRVRYDTQNIKSQISSICQNMHSSQFMTEG